MNVARKHCPRCGVEFPFFDDQPAPEHCAICSRRLAEAASRGPVPGAGTTGAARTVRVQYCPTVGHPAAAGREAV